MILQNLTTTNRRKSDESKYDRKLTKLDVANPVPCKRDLIHPMNIYTHYIALCICIQIVPCMDLEIFLLKLEIAPYYFDCTLYLSKCLVINRSLSKFHCSVLLIKYNPYTNNPKLAALALKLLMNHLKNFCSPESCLFCGAIFPSLLKV